MGLFVHGLFLADFSVGYLKKQQKKTDKIIKNSF
jgi:hypothetical protein